MKGLAWGLLVVAGVMLGIGFWLTWPKPQPVGAVADDPNVGEACRAVLKDLNDDSHDWQTPEHDRLYYFRRTGYGYGFRYDGRTLIVNEADVTKAFNNDEMNAIRNAVEVRKEKVRDAALNRLQGRKR